MRAKVAWWRVPGRVGLGRVLPDHGEGMDPIGGSHPSAAEGGGGRELGRPWEKLGRFGLGCLEEKKRLLGWAVGRKEKRKE